MTLKPTLNTSTLRENPLPSPDGRAVYGRANWPAKYRTLSRGKTGADVYMLQMRLTELGYYHGSVTGGYYGGTIQAVKDFQKDHGLTVDGAAGKQTQALLFSDAVGQTAAQPEETSVPVADTPVPTAAPTFTPEPTPTPQPTFTPTPDPALYMPIQDSVG